MARKNIKNRNDKTFKNQQALPTPKNWLRPPKKNLPFEIKRFPGFQIGGGGVYSTEYSKLKLELKIRSDGSPASALRDPVCSAAVKGRRC